MSQGANAKQTNRSNDGAKGLIKSGKEAAMVELVIANKGPGVYMPDLFGDAITVERKITKARRKADACFRAPEDRRRESAFEQLRRWAVDALRRRCAAILLHLL